jgi:hypothetical protein
MNHEEEIISRVNKFFETHTFEIFYYPDAKGEYTIPTNVKAEITGIREYISMGNEKEFVTVTVYILPSNKISDQYSSIMRSHFGSEKKIETYDAKPYENLVWVIREKMDELMKYFSLPESMITKVVNEIEPTKMNESLIVEGQLDKTTRMLVQDVIKFFKYQREGEYGLPEDLSQEEMVYSLPGFEGFSIFLDLQTDEDIEGVDVDGDLYFDDDIVNITIISNPNAGYTNLDELTRELNDIIRHELEHIKQHRDGMKMPSREPKSPEKYYTQPHELGAQRAGFRKRAKSEKADFETIVRQWFEKNSHKHNLNPTQKEKVIQKILDTK